jgi:hypothetical protein
VPLPAGTHTIGPDVGTLSVRTGRTGAAAKAGHDLLIHVTAWEATLEVGDDPADASIELRADGGSLRVREGTGGMQALGADDKASIEKTIDEEILGRQPVRFRSTGVEPVEDGRFRVPGDLTLVGRTNPVVVDLVVAEGRTLRASTVIAQTAWGITPYSTLFGALKVKDEVRVELVATLPGG